MLMAYLHKLLAYTHIQAIDVQNIQECIVIHTWSIYYGYYRYSIAWPTHVLVS